MAHAQESGHWYDPKTGAPVWEVPGANGKAVTPDIRHARKFGLVPGVTSIIKCAAAPGLQRWRELQVLLAALTLSLIEGESEDAYLARIMRDSQEQAKKAAERGTAIHAAIQEYFEDRQPSGQFDDYIDHVLGTEEAVRAWAGNEVRWVAEESFAHPVGFGGKTDLHSTVFVLDFKTKEFDANTKLDTYDEHHMQLAAYREGLGMPTARCAIVYVSVTVPGLAVVKEISEPDLQRGWACFQALLAFWKAKNRILTGETK